MYIPLPRYIVPRIQFIIELALRILKCISMLKIVKNEKEKSPYPNRNLNQIIYHGKRPNHWTIQSRLDPLY